MTQLSPEEISRRSKAAWALRDRWKTILQDAYELVLAGVNPYASDKKNPRSMEKQFDSTAVAGVIRLVNRILTEMTPADQNWVDVKAGPLLEMQFETGQIEQLEKTVSSISKITNIVVNSGAAVDARASAFLDCVVGGLGAILGMEDSVDDIEPIIDQAVSQSEVAIEEDAKGRISGVYRKRVIKVREIASVWPDAEIPEELTNMKGKDKDPEVEVLEATYAGGPRSNIPWYYEVLYCKSGNDPARMVSRNYDVCPWTIFRWMKLPGIPYGPGPVLLALADIRTANKVMEMILKNAALALAGMYMVRDDGVLNPDNVMITPGGLLTVQSTGGTMGASIAPLTTNREFNVGEIVLDNLRTAIRKQLFDTGLPPDRATPRSATEIIQRIREFNQDLGVGVGRMQADVVQYVRRRIEILAKRGLVPPVKIDQYTLKIQINAPLARAQKLSEVETVVNWVQTSIALGGQNSAFVVANIDKILVWIGQQMGVPKDLIRTDTEQKQVREQQQAAAIAQASAPQLSQQAV